MSPSRPPSIFTLTGNLLAERTLEFSQWTAGQTQRAQRESFQVGGKGIIVAKMLQRLGAPTTALYFAGGAAGTECTQWLGRQKFASQAFTSTTSTRIGIVIRGGSQPETTFFSPDTPPDAGAVRACADYLDAQPAGQVLAVCGSVPGWSTPEFNPLRAAFARWLKRGHLVGDAYGPPLVWLAEQPLALIKINAAELRTLLPPGDVSGASTAVLLKFVAGRSPVTRWIVTDGASPVWYCERDNAPVSVSPPRVSEVSPTGSGDVLFACVLKALYDEGASLAQAVTQALPYAAANAAHAGIAEFPLP